MTIIRILAMKILWLNGISLCRRGDVNLPLLLQTTILSLYYSWRSTDHIDTKYQRTQEEAAGGYNRTSCSVKSTMVECTVILLAYSTSLFSIKPQKDAFTCSDFPRNYFIPSADYLDNTVSSWELQQTTTYHYSSQLSALKAKALSCQLKYVLEWT